MCETCGVGERVSVETSSEHGPPAAKAPSCCQLLTVGINGCTAPLGVREEPVVVPTAGEVISMPDTPGDVLTIDELSAYLKISKSTLYKLVREGKVPCQKIGRHWRFRKEAIDRWLEDLPSRAAAQTGSHGAAPNRQRSQLGRAEGVPGGRKPGKARVKDGGNE